MIQNNMFYDRQAEACAAAFARARFIHAVKALKDARQMFRSDAGAEVANKELNAVFKLMRADDDFLSALGVAQGIADEVAEDLVDGVIVRHDRTSPECLPL